MWLVVALGRMPLDVALRGHATTAPKQDVLGISTRPYLSMILGLLSVAGLVQGLSLNVQ